jgi:aldehyde dehydrogenase (NAD+)
MDLWHDERLLVDGDLVAADGGRTYPTLDPSTGEELGVAADASVADAERAVAAARRAFDTTAWSTDVALRERCLRQLHQGLVKEQDRLRPLVVSDVGVPVMLTHGPALDTPTEMVEWYADLLSRYEFTHDLGEAEVRGAPHLRWVEREAVGVVAAIVPYNYPIQISLAKLVPALAAGCTVVLKGPPQTPWATAALARVVAEHTDIPPGVVNVLTSSAVEVGRALVTDPRVDMVSFTGSTPAGRSIMAAAAPTVKKVFLELGGKSACIVVDDADLDLAAMVAAFTITSHAGQGCAITSRLLVPAAQADAAAETVAGMLAGVAFGDPHDPATMMGPLISEEQRSRVDGHVQRAVAEGARLATGGRAPDRPGFFYEPTLLTGVGRGDAVAQEEVFGPVLALIAYEDDDDAVAIANDSAFGLSGTVLGTDEERATAIARRLRVGTVSINGGMWYGPDTPFGGYKQSGIGREMGVAGLEEYLETKTLAVPRG